MSLRSAPIAQLETPSTAHIVNLNNPSSTKGYIRETVPVGPFSVGLEIPTGAKVKAVRLLEADKPARILRSGNRLIIAVPRMQMHEVIAIDLT